MKNTSICLVFPQGHMERCQVFADIELAVKGVDIIMERNGYIRDTKARTYGSITRAGAVSRLLYRKGRKKKLMVFSTRHVFQEEEVK